MSYDFNGADRQSSGFDPIPAGTIVPLTMSIRPGGAGDGGWFKQSQSSDALMLDCEFVVSEGPYAKRKIWQFLIVSGGKLNERGESTAGNITRATLRAILESARGIRPDDMGESAQAARRIDGWQDFCGLTFIAKLGVEKDKTGQYADKNRIHTVIHAGHEGVRPAAGDLQLRVECATGARPSFCTRSVPYPRSRLGEVEK